MTCQYCGKECKNELGLNSHEKSCKLNPSNSKQPVPLQIGLGEGDLFTDDGLTYKITGFDSNGYYTSKRI